VTGPIEAFAGAPPRAVTFDFWDTLVQANTAGSRSARLASMTTALERIGRPHLAEHLDETLDSSVRAYVDQWFANRQFTAEEGAAHVIGVLSEIEVASGARPLDQDEIELVVVAFVHSAEGMAHELTPNVAVALEALVDAGVPVGIVCDVGMTPSDILRSYLDENDVLRHFDHWAFSDEVGVYKPDAAIFRHALDGLGIDEPGRVAHVGDLNRTDVAGALGMGMVAIRYAGMNDDGHHTLPGGPEVVSDAVLPDAHAVLHDHAELPALLGLS
jgi:putative hydrolase of the HAD superfamily